MTTEQIKTQAVITPLTDVSGAALSADAQRNQAVTVQFNPEKLQLSLSNEIKKGEDDQPAQMVTEATASLAMELVFDTTTTGEDVRGRTHAIARLMDPRMAGDGNTENKVPSIVRFEWGTVKFEGYIDNYSEAIDFFSSEGVPLRSTLTLSLTQHERALEPNTNVAYDNDTGGDFSAGGGNAQQTPMGGGQSVTDLASKAGNPAAARGLGALNGVENLRLPEVDNLLVADFEANAVAKAGVGFKAGAGASFTAGFNAGASAGTSFSSTSSSSFTTSTRSFSTRSVTTNLSNTTHSSSLTISSSRSESVASNSFSASAGTTSNAFAGLKASASTTAGASLSLGAGASASIGGGIGIGGGAGIGIGVGAGAGIGIGAGAGAGIGLGAAGGAGASLSADVGVDADFKAGIKFED